MTRISRLLSDPVVVELAKSAEVIPGGRPMHPSPQTPGRPRSRPATSEALIPTKTPPSTARWTRSTTHSASSGIKLNHREPHLCNGAVVAIRGADLAAHTAGARFYRRRWDSAVGVRADYQGSYEGIARNISIAETKQNPLPPTLS